MEVSTRPFLNLSVTLRPLSSHTVEKLPVQQVAGVEVESATRDLFEGVSNTFLEPSALSTAQLDFGTLSAGQFERLRGEFGGQSRVPYAAGRNYEAADFLPPAMQALLAHDLELPERVQIPGTAKWELLPFGEGSEEDRSIDLTANCHGTSWEAMQAYQGQADLDIFFGDAVRMESLLDDAKTFRPLATAGPGQNLEQTLLRAGDAVAFFNPQGGSSTNLLHTAVYAGGGLFFEKPDTEGGEGSDAPYRLSTMEMAKTPIEHFLDGPVEIKAYRPVASLEKPETAFSGMDASTVAEWEKEQGRPLGMPLLSQLELGIGGGVRGEYLTTSYRQPVVLDSSGRGRPG